MTRADSAYRGEIHPPADAVQADAGDPPQVDRDGDRDADEEAERRGEDGDGRAGDPGIGLGDANAAKQGRRDEDYERSDAEEAKDAGPCARVAIRARPAF